MQQPPSKGPLPRPSEPLTRPKHPAPHERSVMTRATADIQEQLSQVVEEAQSQATKNKGFTITPIHIGAALLIIGGVVYLATKKGKKIPEPVIVNA